MKRRKFLKTAAVGYGVVLADTSRLKVSAQATNRGSPLEPFELDELTISDLQEGMRSGKYSSSSLTNKYLERIRQIDAGGPRINSVIELNPDAPAIAATLDQERREKGSRGPLHGIPILIKDNIDTADRMMTTAGSLALAGPAPAQDAFVVKRLRDAGAVILGKTNLSEWANFRSSHSTSGWSARGGQTRNPYVLDRNPCGSSSGSGVATAANLCAAAIGTETDGSIVCPSSANSLVGIKPTLGLVSRSGIVPIAHSQDTAGPMARTVRDAAILLSILSAFDPGDKAIKIGMMKSAIDYTQFLDKAGLQGARLGIVRKFLGFNDHVDKLMATIIAEMKGLGASVIDPVEIPSAGKFDDSEFQVLLYEFKADLNAYLRRRPQTQVRSLKELIDFNETHHGQELAYFGQDIFLKAEQKGSLASRDYLAALKKNHLLSRSQGIDLALRKHRLDALVAPTGGPAWSIDWANGDHFSGGYASPSAVAGYPHITVPAGYIFGLPVGISLFGTAYSEPKLIRLAYALEQATKVRRPPRFLSSAEFG